MESNKLYNEDIISTNALRALDQLSQEEFAVPGLLLMEEAGLKIAQALLRDFSKKHKSDPIYLFLLGKGNNAGDGMVAARHLHARGKRVALVHTYEDRGPDSVLSSQARAQRDICKRQKIPQIFWNPEEDANSKSELSDFLKDLGLKNLDLEKDKKDLVLIDALLGSGARGSLSSPFEQLLDYFFQHEIAISTIDFPSQSLSVQWRNYSCNRSYCLGLRTLESFEPQKRSIYGKVVFIPLAFPPEAFAELKPVTVEFLNRFKKEYLENKNHLSSDAHKGDRGSLLIMGGSKEYIGAPKLSARAASHGPASLITLASEENVLQSISKEWNFLMVKKPEDVNYEKYSALVLGPGWSRKDLDNKGKILKDIWSRPIPLVLDADGLFILSMVKDQLPRRSSPTVLTPHLGELATLLGITKQELLDAWQEKIRILAQDLSCHIIAKAACTWIVSPEKIEAIYEGRESLLACGGSGDILAGFLGSLLASGMDVLQACYHAVTTHGEAGKKAAKKYDWLSADELIEYLGNKEDKKGKGKNDD